MHNKYNTWFPGIIVYVALLVSVAFSLIFLGCAQQILDVTYPTLGDGNYDSEFPYRNSSKQLEEIGNSVKLLSVIAFYKNFIIEEEAQLKQDEITRRDFESLAVETIFYNSSVSGTATIIHYSVNSKIGLITCAHVVDFPDTVITYYDKEKTIIQSIAVKDRQINYVNDLPEGGDVEIIYTDSELDIAILGLSLTRPPVIPIPVFNYPFGKASDLDWGSFVYLFGYPAGNKMITKGIVSSPKREKNRAFLIDAPFNRGSSGGIVLAIRDGIPNFELVGIANSVSANFDYVLGPKDDPDLSNFDAHLPYTDEIYLKKQENIRYGITHIIAIEAIIKKLKANSDELEKLGYDLSNLY